MDRVKSIDELYEEVKDYDYVLCNDAPLTTALNNRLDKAQLGPFAITPRQFAAQKAIEFTGKPLVNDIRLVKEIADELEFSMKYVHGEIENIKTALRYTHDPRMDRKPRKVWEELKRYSKGGDKQYVTLENVLLDISDAAKRFFAPYKVAVVGLSLFDNLDKQVIPEKFDEIEIVDYTSEFTIPTFRILGNDRQIADCAVDLAKQCNPTDIAIVIDTDGPIADCVKSALYREKMPFINSLNVRDIESVRNFLEFIRLALSFETILVKDARNFIQAYGGWISTKYENHYLTKFHDSKIGRDDRTAELLELMAKIRTLNFGDVLANTIPPRERSSVSMLLKQMGCTDEKVSQSLLDDLNYAVNNIGSLTHNEQIPDTEKKGVLLVDCKNSAYIDRPVVIYTGMCNEWEVDLGNIHYIDSKKIPDIEEQYAIKFNALIQQGSVRFYLVNATKEGKEAVPCRYFEECMYNKINLEEDEVVSIDRFDQICKDKPIKGAWRIKKIDRSGHKDEDETILESEELPETFSKSSYNKFAECPRQYMLSILTDSQDNTATYLGTKIHDYAEFRISYPELAKENGCEFYANMIADECASLNSPDLDGVERSRISAAINAIDKLIEDVGATPGELRKRAEDKGSENMFLAYHGLENVSEHSERELTSRDQGMKGIIDLLWNGIVYDYKSGKKKSPKDLYKLMDLTDVIEGKQVEYKEFQPLLYLCLMDEFEPDSKRTFDLFYSERLYEQMLLGIDQDYKECIRSVVVCDDNEKIVTEYLSKEPVDEIDGKTIDLNVVYEVCMRESDGDPNNWAGNKMITRILVERYGIGGSSPEERKKNNNAVAKLVKNLSKSLCSDHIETGNTLILRSSVIDSFRKKLKEDLDNVRRYYVDGFPLEHIKKCDNCSFRDICIPPKGKEAESDE